MKATYLHPYQMHGSMGSSCAVADVQGDKATIWSPTQAAYPTRSGSAMLLGLPAENVRVIFTRGSGCYGINGADTVSYDAALLSQAVGKPVRVQLSRKDEMAWENYGVAFVIDQRVGLDADGTIVAWDYEALVAGARRPAGLRHARATSITGLLAGLRAGAVRAARAGAGAGGASTTTATRCRRTWPAASAGAAAAPARSRASACCRTPCGRRSSPARCARRRGCRTRSRTSRSWTSSRRT